MTKKQENPIVGEHRGKKVRKYNLVVMRVNQFEYKQFIDARIDYGMTARDAIHYRKAMCNVCNPIEVALFKK